MLVAYIADPRTVFQLVYENRLPNLSEGRLCGKKWLNRVLFKSCIMKSKYLESLKENPPTLVDSSKRLWTLFLVSQNGKRLYEFSFENMKVRFQHLSSVTDFLISNSFD